MATAAAAVKAVDDKVVGSEVKAVGGGVKAAGAVPAKADAAPARVDVVRAKAARAVADHRPARRP